MDQQYQRLIKRYERIFTPAIYRGIKKQIDQYLMEGRLSDVTSDPIIDVLEKLYKQVGGAWAFETDRQIRRDLKLPRLGYSERIANLIKEQYGPEILNMSNKIEQTTKDHIRVILQNSIDQNLTLNQTTEQIRLLGPSEARARIIARTETIRAANAGAMVNANEKGYVLQKKWFSAMDNRTRHDHKKLDGQVVDKTQPFKVKDKDGITQEMMFPGDTSLGADPSQTINCRCSMQFIVK